MVSGWRVADAIRASRRTPTHDQGGSTVVAALGVAVVLAVLASSVVARSSGALAGATAAHDRIEARAIAEDVLHAGILGLDDHVAASTYGTAARTIGLAALTDRLTAAGDGVAALQVDIGEDGEEFTLSVAATVGTATADASARLRARSSVDVAWFVESSARDPRLQALPRIACTWPQGDERRHAACRDTPIPTEWMGGPVHSNDRLVDDEAGTADGLVTSSAVGNPGVRHRSEMRLPRDAIAVLGGRSPTCRFRGPTMLRFDGPRVRVTSPRSVPREDEPHGIDGAIGCLGAERSELAGVVEIDLPPSAIIEVVDDVRNDCVQHPLGLRSTEDYERTWPCDAGDVFVWGRYEGVRTVIAHDSIQVVWDLEPGDADGARSLGHGDLMGLVAGESIVLRRPWGSEPGGSSDSFFRFGGAGIPPFGTYPLDAPAATPTHWDAPRVVAAVAALRGSLAPQNAAYGDLPSGPITLVGSLASRFGPAMTWDAFDRQGRPVGIREFPFVLEYDERLVHRSPPAMPHIDGGRLRILELDVG